MAKDSTRGPQPLNSQQACMYLKIGRTRLTQLKAFGLLTPVKRGAGNADLYDIAQLDHVILSALDRTSNNPSQ